MVTGVSFYTKPKMVRFVSAALFGVLGKLPQSMIIARGVSSEYFLERCNQRIL